MGFAGLTRRDGTLAAYAAGLFVCYLAYGVFQEELTSTLYDGASRFHYFFFMLLAQCLANLAVAAVLLGVTRQPLDAIPPRRYAALSLCYILAMFTSNMALMYVPYPTQALAKSCKIIPVMLAGAIILRKRYSAAEVACVLAITGGVVLFNLSRSSSLDFTFSGVGEVLILLSLFCDGYMSAMQDRVVDQYAPGSYSLMFKTNLFGAAFSLLGSLATGEFLPAVQMLLTYPRLVVDIALYAMSSAFGQVFIFLILRNFKPLTLSIVTTTRKFFTILASVVLFGHRLGAVQWLAIAIVFGGLFAEITIKKRAKRGGAGSSGSSDANDAADADRASGSDSRVVTVERSSGSASPPVAARRAAAHAGDHPSWHQRGVSS